MSESNFDKYAREIHKPENRSSILAKKSKGRGRNGQFLRGHEPIIRPKYVYSQYYPKLYCNTCWTGRICPEYKKGCICAYKKGLKSFKTRKIDDAIDGLSTKVDKNLSRLQYLAVSETMSGEVLDINISRLIARISSQLFLLYNLYVQKEYSKTVQTPIDDKTLESLLTRIRTQSARNTPNS